MSLDGESVEGREVVGGARSYSNQLPIADIRHNQGGGGDTRQWLKEP